VSFYLKQVLAWNVPKYVYVSEFHLTSIHIKTVQTVKCILSTTLTVIMPSIRNNLAECKKNIQISQDQIKEYDRSKNVVDKEQLRMLLTNLKGINIDHWLDAMDVTIQIATEIKILLRREGRRRQLAKSLQTASSRGKVKQKRREEELAAESDYCDSDPDSNGQSPMTTDV
jgi:hypothetical protein